MRKVSDITISDDGCGLYKLSLSGVDAQYFKIIGRGLYFLLSDEELTKSTYSVTVLMEDLANRFTPKSDTFTLSINHLPSTSTTTTTTTLPPPLSGIKRNGLTHPISNVLTGIDLGYSVIHAYTASHLHSCNILLSVNKFGYGADINGSGMGYMVAPEILNNLESWVRAGGIYMYQTEHGLLGNASVANNTMMAAGSSLRSLGGVSSSNGSSSAISTNSPCVNGISFYTGVSARISGGVNLVYDPLFGTNPSILRGEYVGNGCVLLLGDTGVISSGTIFSPLYPSWLEFMTRLMTIPANQLL